MSGIQHHILHAEDNPDDALLIQIALKKSGVPFTITTLEDGAKVLEYLKGEKEFADRHRFPLPTLALLDIKIPRYSGLEVLEWLRSQGRFAALPIVMLTSSRNLADVRRAYELGVNAYVVKAVEYEELQDTIRTVAAFWLRKNVLPI
jgi:CheY-like chemotaxis protein